MGRLTADPELKRTPNNVAVTTFTLAVERDFKTQDGSKETDFFSIVAWRNLAEFVSKYFSKGRMAAVEGRLQTRKYQDKDGNNRTVTEILADNVYFGDSKNNAVSSTPAFAEMDEGEDDENLPF
jgi:single-strand DNA-binding protein